MVCGNQRNYEFKILFAKAVWEPRFHFSEFQFVVANVAPEFTSTNITGWRCKFSHALLRRIVVRLIK